MDHACPTPNGYQGNATPAFFPPSGPVTGSFKSLHPKSNSLAFSTFFTSEGTTNRDEANAKPARWIAMSGTAGTGKASIAILGHPENFRAPQPLRVHPTEPFISFAPQLAGVMKISHEETYRSEYRFILFAGAPDKELLNRHWNDYAEPPTAT